MYTVLLAGGIGSGKSTVARELERLGAVRLDLDQLSRDVLAAGSPVTRQIAEAFGEDLLDPQTGALDRRLLAQRAFVSPAAAAQLEALELPAISALLRQRLGALAQRTDAPALCVVEVPLLDRLESPDELADEVVVVCCPRELRRARAIGRGMTGDDFDARAANQPSDAWLRAHATTIFENEGTPDELVARVHAWYSQRFAEEDGR